MLYKSYRYLIGIVRNLEEIGTRSYQHQGYVAQWQDRSLSEEERPSLVQDDERPYFSLLSLIVYTIQAPTEAVFQNLLSVLKMYSAHNENYRFSVLAVLAAKIL